MDKKVLKKEFRALCRSEKRSCLRMKTAGTLVAMIGLIAALAVLCFVVADAIKLGDVIILNIFIIIVCAVGAALDAVGDFRFKREFARYLLEKENRKTDSEPQP